MHSEVYHRGPAPSLWMIVGEAPGRDEAREGLPFVGQSGAAQDWYLSRHGLHSSSAYVTNLVKTYIDGNPDPTPELIEQWTPYLIYEIGRVRPKVILAVGRFAVEWFLGMEEGGRHIDMDAVHGMPHEGGEFDLGIAGRARAQGAIIMPCFHPAYGFYSPDAKTLIDYDYAQAARVIKLVREGRAKEVAFRKDEWAGRETYEDVTGRQIVELIEMYSGSLFNATEVGIDTEDTPSIQISMASGTGFTLRQAQPDFQVGVAAIQRLVDTGCTVITHDAGTSQGCMYDTVECRKLGLELKDAPSTWNTMDAAFLTRIEPKGLKALMYRWCGMKQSPYRELVNDISKQMQVEYLIHVMTRAKEWPKPEMQIIYNNDGTMQPYQPQHIAKTAERTLNDIWSGKLSKDGKPTDPWKRWYAIDDVVRAPVERVLGRMPRATLADVDPVKATVYSGRDADGTRRVMFAQIPEIERLGLMPLMRTRMDVLPIFEEMQREGMPGKRSRFKALEEYVTSTMQRTQGQISHLYYDDMPFNPNSDDQVRILLRRRGLRGEKLTKKTRLTSVAKKSIEHLRVKDDAVDKIIIWKEAAKVKGTYVEPTLRIAAAQPIDTRDPDHFIVRCKFKPVTVETRRLSSEDPSLLNQPSRTELGRRVRECYETTGDEMLGELDYSGQEMRVAAHVALLSSSTSKLAELFQKGMNPHKWAASLVYGIPYEQVGKGEEYNSSKVANFGILYGMSGGGLQDLFRSFGLLWDIDDCQKLIDSILKDVYPELSVSIEAIRKETARTGMVRDLFGMIRYLPGIWSKDRKEAAEAGRQAFSHMIQGTAQGMIQNAMAWLRPYIRSMQLAGLNVVWCLQVHDSLMFRFENGLWEMIEPLVREGMIEHCGIKLKVPVEVEGKQAKNWKDLK